MRLPILALVAAAAVASAATTSDTSSTTAFGTNAYASLALKKFDTNLGTLTGVELRINELSISGTITATAIGGNGELSWFGTTGLLRQNPTNSLGFSTVNFSDDTDTNLVLTPGVGAALTQNIAQEFSITKYIFVEGSQSSVSSANWGAYEGTGYVYFQLKHLPLSSVTSPTGLFTNSTALAFADMTVTYTYTPSPVPEPSTYGAILGGLALAGAAIRRRRKAA